MNFLQRQIALIVFYDINDFFQGTNYSYLRGLAVDLVEYPLLQGRFPCCDKMYVVQGILELIGLYICKTIPSPRLSIP
jgi:hypothetical protein